MTILWVIIIKCRCAGLDSDLLQARTNKNEWRLSAMLLPFGEASRMERSKQKTLTGFKWLWIKSFWRSILMETFEESLPQTDEWQACEMVNGVYRLSLVERLFCKWCSPCASWERERALFCVANITAISIRDIHWISVRLSVGTCFGHV